MPEKGGILSSRKEAKPAGALSRVLVFFLLVFIIITAGLAANGKLAPLLASIDAELGGPAIEPAPAKPKEAPKPKLKQAVEAEAPRDLEPELVTKEDEESKALQAAIEQLGAELRSIKAAEASLRREMREQQQESLQKRLGWITDPASRTSHLELAWKEISELPGLSEPAQAEAEAMHQLAHSSAQRLRSWQRLLREHAESLEVSTGENLIPVPQHPWLASVAEQFQLRRASTAKETLREELLAVSHVLAEEQWPADDAWQRLTEKLLQRARLTAAVTTVTELGLPDNFSAVKKDIKRLRDAARGWGESGMDGAESP